MRKIFSALLAILVVASLTVCAFAATDPSSTASGVWTYASPADPSSTGFVINGLSLTMTGASGMEVPNEVFTFSIVPNADHDATAFTGPALTSVAGNKITFTNADNFPANGSLTKAIPNNTFVCKTAFPRSGIYCYKISVSSNRNLAEETYDSAVFYVDVYANSDGEVIQIITKNSNGVKQNISYANQITAAPLKVEKQVDLTGNSLSDPTVPFSFTLTISPSASGGVYTGAKSYKVTKSTGETMSDLTIGTAYSFTLKHGEYITLANLPYDLQYVVSEAVDNANSHVVKEATINGTNASDYDAAAGYQVKGNLALTGNDVLYVNYRPTTTGVFIELTPYVVLLAAAAIAATAFFMSFRKKEEI